MSKANEALVDSLDKLVVVLCSMRWSLVHWLIKKLLGESQARDFGQLALTFYPLLQREVLTHLRKMSGEDIIALLVMLSKKWRYNFLQSEKRLLTPQVEEVRSNPFFADFKHQLEKGFRQLADQNVADQRPMGERLYPELQCDLKTLWNEPRRAEKAFPMEILKSPREQKRLQSELGYEPDNYARQLISILWELGNNPYSLGLPSPRSNDLIFEVAGKKPSEDITGGQAATALVCLFKALGDEQKARVLFQHGMARVLRHQFDLSRDRNVDSFSEVDKRHRVTMEQKDTDPDVEPWEPEDTLSLRGYDGVDYRLEYEALRNRLPRKQKVALDVYLESFDTGESIERICARKQLGAVVVRNNFQAVKRKVRLGKT